SRPSRQVDRASRSVAEADSCSHLLQLQWGEKKNLPNSSSLGCFSLVFCSPEITMRCNNGYRCRAAPSRKAHTARYRTNRGLVEACFPMNKSDERPGLIARHDSGTDRGIEEEEPPGKPKRHPLWRDVPDRQWDDWRWQSQNAIRSVRQLRDLLPFTPEELEAIGSLEAEYKPPHPPDYFSPINTAHPQYPIPLPSGTS